MKNVRRQYHHLQYMYIVFELFDYERLSFVGFTDFPLLCHLWFGRNSCLAWEITFDQSIKSDSERQSDC